MVLSTNGYPKHVIRTAAGPRRKRKQQEEPPKYTICLPYVAGLGEELRRVCRMHDIQTVFTTMDTLRRQLTRVKDTDLTLKTSGVVYRIYTLQLWTGVHRRDQEEPGDIDGCPFLTACSVWQR